MFWFVCVCFVSWKLRNLENRANFQITFKMFGQRVASLVKLYVNLKNFCTARKRSRYEFSGTVLCRTCLSGRKRLSIHSFYSLIFSYPTQQDCVLRVSTPWTNNSTNYCQYLSLAESWYTNVELLYLSVRAVWLVNLACRTLLYGPLNSCKMPEL